MRMCRFVLGRPGGRRERYQRECAAAGGAALNPRGPRLHPRQYWSVIKRDDGGFDLSECVGTKLEAVVLHGLVELRTGDRQVV